MRCPYCNSTTVHKVFAGNMPNILSACSADFKAYVRTFPISIHICQNCFLGYNSAPLDSEGLKYIYDNYGYISPLSGIGTSKYTGILALLEKHFAFDKKMVEIGCSEGYIMSKLREKGYSDLLGIEPGPQAETALQSGFRVIKDYFKADTLTGNFDGFYLMHVFEHLPDPFAILALMLDHLTPEGKIVIEVPNFSGYHHQHLYFFSMPFWRFYSERAQFKIVDYYEDVNILRLVLTHKGNVDFPAVSIPAVAFDEFYSSIKQKWTDFQAKIDKLKARLKEADVLYLWGAGSSAVIYLSQLDVLPENKIVVIDGDPQKWGKYIPGTSLQVNSNELLKNKTIDYMVILSEFAEEIEARLGELSARANNLDVIV